MPLGARALCRERCFRRDLAIALPNGDDPSSENTEKEAALVSESTRGRVPLFPKMLETLMDVCDALFFKARGVGVPPLPVAV